MTLFSCFTGPQSPDPATLGLTALKLVTEAANGTWAQTRAKMLREAVPGAVLNIEEGKSIVNRLVGFKLILSLLYACRQKGWTGGVYGLSRTNWYPADPDKPTVNLDTEASLASSFKKYVDRVDCDGYMPWSLAQLNSDPLVMIRAYKQAIIQHRQITRLMYGTDKPIRWWTMAFNLQQEPLSQGTLENIAYLYKDLIGAGDSLVLFSGLEPWGIAHVNFVKTFSRIIGQPTLPHQ